MSLATVYWRLHISRLVLTGTFLLVFGNCNATTTSHKFANDPINRNLIIGGSPVENGRFPSFVFPVGTTLCGGTLIHEDIILTAAHCGLDAFVDGAFIGGVNIDGSTSVLAATETSIIHPDYNSNNYDNDIMLVKLVDPSTAPIQVVNLDDPTVPADGEELFVIGYGDTSQDGAISDILNGVTVNAYSFADCDAFWGRINNDIHLCASVPEGGRDSCQGDSGGPLMTSSGVQVGIVSNSIGCGAPNTPSQYVRTSGFGDWISQNICDLSDAPPTSCGAVVLSPAPVAIPATPAPIEFPPSSPAPSPAPVAVPATPAPIESLPTSSAPVAVPPPTSLSPTTLPPVLPLPTTSAPVEVAVTPSPTINPTMAPVSNPPTLFPVAPIPTTLIPDTPIPTNPVVATSSPSVQTTDFASSADTEVTSSPSADTVRASDFPSTTSPALGQGAVSDIPTQVRGEDKDISSSSYIHAETTTILTVITLGGAAMFLTA